MKIRVLIVVVAGLYGFCETVPGAAQETGERTAAIRAGSEEFVKAFNAGSAKSIAALWTLDGEYVDDSGRHFVGREEIEQGYAEFFAENPKSKIQVTIDSIRLLTDDTAIEDGRAAVVTPAGDSTGSSKYTVVHVKVDETWKMASVRDAMIQPPRSVISAADLEWLIGTWKAEEHGVTTLSVCRWVADGGFIERRYTATHVDGTSSSAIQIVGWNPAEGHVQSWSFSPDGSHAVGVWMPQQDGWVAQIRGTASDGLPTSSVNRLRKLDDNAYVWQSLDRSVGGTTMPDTQEVVWKRQPEETK